MNNLLQQAYERLTTAGYVVTKETMPVRDDDGLHDWELMGLQIYAPGILIQGAHMRIVEAIKGIDVSVWSNPNTETIYVKEN